VYYSDANDLETAATFQPQFLAVFYQSRHPSTQLRQVAVSSVLNNRATVVVPVQNGFGRSRNGDADVTGSSAILGLSAPTYGSKRHLFMRGLADGDILRDPFNNDDPSPYLRLCINILLNNLERNGYVIQSKSKVSQLAPFVNISSIAPTANMANTSTVTFNNPDTQFVAGANITIGQVDPKILPGLVGTFQCLTGTNSNAAIIAYNTPGGQAIKLKKGRARTFVYQYGFISAALSGFQKFGTRITGKNPLGGRGRRRGVHLRLA
jgi:hypothetical protein